MSRSRSRWAMAAAAATAVALMAVPTAAASPDGTQCGKRGGAKVCQKPGHSSVFAEPKPVVGGPTAPGLFDRGWQPGFGRGMPIATSVD